MGAPHVIPENLQRAVIARLDCLNPTDKYVLQTASVLGPSFSADVLQRMLASEFDAPSFVDYLERLRQHEFLHTAPGKQVRDRNVAKVRGTVMRRSDYGMAVCFDQRCYRFPWM